MAISIFPAKGDSLVRDWTVSQLLDDAAARDGDRIAVRAGDLSWTYQELRADSERLAEFLHTHFQPGEHVAIWGSNSAPWLLYQLAAARAGLVLVTLNPALLAREVESLLRQSRSAGLIMDLEYRGADLAAIVDGIRPALPALRTVLRMADWRDHLAAAPSGNLTITSQPDDVAMILYTSGTTGAPKGVQLHVSPFASHVP